MLAVAPHLFSGQGRKYTSERSDMKKGAQSQSSFLLRSRKRVVSALGSADFTL